MAFALAFSVTISGTDFFGNIKANRINCYDTSYSGFNSARLDGLGAVSVASDGTALYGWSVSDILGNPLTDFHMNLDSSQMLLFGDFIGTLDRVPVFIRGDVNITHTNLYVAGNIVAGTNIISTNGIFYGNGSGLTNLSVYGTNVIGPIDNASLPPGVLTNNETLVTTFSNGVTIQGLSWLAQSNGTARVLLTNGTITASGQATAAGVTATVNNSTFARVRVTLGSAADAAVGSSVANGTGLYMPNTTNVALTAGGVEQIRLGNNAATLPGTIAPTNGTILQVKPPFTTNFTATISQQVYQCYGTNQVITLPSGAAVNGIIFRFASTNGHGSFILTNTLGTIRDGSSTSFAQIGIGSPAFISTDGGTNWWPAARTKVVFPTAQFSCSTNIPLTLANTAYPITFNSTDFNNSQGIALALGTNGTHYSKMWITNSGQYEFDPSVVISFGGNDIVRYWFKSNDTNIPNSCTPVKGQNNTIRVVTVPFIVNVTQPTAYEIWAESDNNVENILAQAAGGVAPNDYPAAPSIICPIKRISDPWP